MKLSKLDVVRRQLETAISLYFHEGDPVSIHTLAAAAHGVLEDVRLRVAGLRARTSRGRVRGVARCDREPHARHRARAELFLRLRGRGARARRRSTVHPGACRPGRPLEAFLRPHFERGELPRLHGRVLAHVHCHQQALIGREPTEAALAASGLEARVLDGGCCGMAGSFGYDTQHYDVSVAVAERALLPAVRRAPAGSVVLANGFSCREQIQQLAGRRARHFAEVVCDAVRETSVAGTPMEGAA